MNVKKILFSIMCLLLLTVVIMTGVAIARVGQLLATLRSDTPPGSSTPSSGAPSSQPATQPSSQPTQPTQPVTQPSTQPTQPDHVHEYALTETVDATCDGMGYQIYFCAGCEKQDVRNIVDALSHSFGPGQLIDPTCDTQGCMRYTCSRCGYAKDENPTAPIGHSFLLSHTVASTCETAGYDVYLCQICGVEEQRNEVLAAGHQNTTVGLITPPTCILDGIVHYQCTVCGQNSEEILPATGHSFSEWLPGEDGILGRVCSGCGATESSAGFRITGEHISITNDGGKLYVVYVGTEAEPELFFFAIWDHLNNGTMSYQLDAVRGLVVIYTDTTGKSVEIIRYFADPIAIVIQAGR